MATWYPYGDFNAEWQCVCQLWHQSSIFQANRRNLQDDMILLTNPLIFPKISRSASVSVLRSKQIPLVISSLVILLTRGSFNSDISLRWDVLLWVVKMDLIASQSPWKMDAQIGSEGENAFLQSRVLVTSVSLKPFVREREMTFSWVVSLSNRFRRSQ